MYPIGFGYIIPMTVAYQLVGIFKNYPLLWWEDTHTGFLALMAKVGFDDAC